MPKTSTPRQRMIALVRKHLEGPGVTVTESKMLPDPAAGEDREVDVVAERDSDGDPWIVSVEVTDRTTRVPDVGWVEQMWGKHLTLPTNQLFLVSWSGFSKPARAKADFLGVATVTPRPVLEPDGTQRQSEALYFDLLRLTPEVVAVRLRSSDGTSGEYVRVGLEVNVFDGEGTNIGTLRELASAVLRSDNVRRQVNDQAHNADDRERLTAFVLEDTALGDKVQVYLHMTTVEPPEPFRVVGIKIDGRFSWQRTELRFDVFDIDGHAHGIAELPWLGRDAVWVATPKDDGSDGVSLSWRTTGPDGAVGDHESTQRSAGAL